MTNPFLQASLDQSLTALKLFNLHAQHSPDHPLFVFELDGVVQQVSWGRFVKAVDNAARFVLNSIPTLERDSVEGSPPVIGILATSDSVTYYTLSCGVIRAGFQAFLISTRNSSAAIAHLLTKSSCHHIFVSKDPAMQKRASAAAATLAADSYHLDIHEMPHYEDLYVSDGLLPVLPDLPESDGGLETPAFILHSSGSTSFPKPIYITQRILMQWIRHPTFYDGDISKETMAVHALPTFHVMFILTTVWAASTGMIISCFPPVAPPVQPTPEGVLQGAISTKSTMVFSVPSFVEHWVTTPQYLADLSCFRAVAWAGAPLSPAIGNILVQKRIPMLHLYGTTEVGCASAFFTGSLQMEDWEYIELTTHQNHILIPYDDEGRHELVYFENEHHRPCVFNGVVDGRQAFSTNDLFVQHPTNKKLWKIYGRKDDQIMLSIGEKTNPGPIETILCRDLRITHAVMFGRGKEFNGVIVQPPPEYAFDPSDTATLAEFRNHIWSTISSANAFAPKHSRLFKEECLMVLVASPQKPFELTAKNTPRRASVIEAYAQEIEQAYEAVQNISHLDFLPPSRWGATETLAFTRDIVHSIMREAVGDEVDLFQYGCDSLQATFIRNSIRHALKHGPVKSVQELPRNFVYDYPSISSMAQYIVSSMSSPSTISTRSPEESAKAMHELVTEFTQDLPMHRPTVPETPQPGDVILITGTTGALGCHLLAQMVVLPEISRIYAVNRPARNKMALQERQRRSFEDRGLDISLLDFSKVVLIETDVSLPRLGLTESVYNNIKASVTHICHNAWRVNFKTSLITFKPFFQGVRNLIELALGSPHTSPPVFLFMSSVSVLNNWDSPGLAPEAPVDPSIAVGSGYGESKWVAETILRLATQSTPLRATIIRIDQLSGSKNGSWNHEDSIPAIIRSGQVIQCLPDRRDSIAWLPVDTAAASILDIRNASVPYAHLRNPYYTSWHDVFVHFSALLDVGLVPYTQWLSRLTEQSDALEAGVLDARDAPSNPALNLLEFYNSISEDKGPMAVAMDITKTLQICPSLWRPELESALSEREVKKWVDYWIRKGLLVG